MSPEAEPAAVGVFTPSVVEMADTGVARQPSCLIRALRGGSTTRPLTPQEIIQKALPLRQQREQLRLNNPSFYSGITQTDHASTVSRSSGGHAVNGSAPSLV